MSSNRDKELIERVDKYLTKFDEILTKISSDNPSAKMQNIIKECFESELRKKFNEVSEQYERTKDENNCLKQELFRIKAERENNDLVDSTRNEEKQQFIRDLNDLKKQIIDCLPNNDFVMNTINSTIDSNNMSQNQLIEKFEQMFHRIQQLIRIHEKNSPEFIQIEWFDGIV